MSKLTLTSDSAKWFAGVMAIFATVVVIGGPLSLAEHYARTGAAAQHHAGPATVTIDLPKHLA